MVEKQTRRGTLVLADISGYTFYVAQTELAHAETALSYLLETIVDRLNRVLFVAKLEGDAVFAYAEEETLAGGEAVMDLLDETYRAFRVRAEELYRKSTCPCRACRAIPTLDLKFIVHHGEFMLQQVAGIRDLLGSDVNLVHRLLKNHVGESTGWRGYALFTAPALERAGADRALFVRQSESYEHLGPVETFILDMHSRHGEPDVS